MASRIRRRSVPDIWPGFVDAISTLLIIIIFLLMIFTLAQFFLSDLLSGRNAALEQLNKQVAELGEMLALERRANANLRSDLSELSSQIQIMTAAREAMTAEIEALRGQRDELQAALDRALARATEAETGLSEAQKTIEEDRESIRTQLGTIAALKNDIAALRKVRDDLEKRVTALAASLEENRAALTAARDRSKTLSAELSTERERTALAQKEIETLGARVSNLATALEANRSELTSLRERSNSQESLLSTEREVSARATAQVTLLNRQLAALRQQLARISAALETSEARAREQSVQILDLGKRLNAALANKVAELARYRSEFFGKLRDALGNEQGVRIEGDRFVFQSEVLFDSASADLSGVGPDQIRRLAATLKEIAGRIPPDIDWVLRVDGHTDIRPIRTVQFPSNWELSAARAIAVVKQLIAAGIPANRLVAAGFGAEHPLNRGATVNALAQNRRIEFKLTNR
jgi:chemotaxis protein MotB